MNNNLFEQFDKDQKKQGGGIFGDRDLAQKNSSKYLPSQSPSQKSSSESVSPNRLVKQPGPQTIKSVHVPLPTQKSQQFQEQAPKRNDLFSGSSNTGCTFGKPPQQPNNQVQLQSSGGALPQRQNNFIPPALQQSQPTQLQHTVNYPNSLGPSQQVRPGSGTNSTSSLPQQPLKDSFERFMDTNFLAKLKQCPRHRGEQLKFVCLNQFCENFGLLCSDCMLTQHFQCVQQKQIKKLGQFLEELQERYGSQGGVDGNNDTQLIAFREQSNELRNLHNQIKCKLTLMSEHYGNQSVKILNKQREDSEAINMHLSRVTGQKAYLDEQQSIRELIKQIQLCEQNGSPLLYQRMEEQQKQLNNIYQFSEQILADLEKFQKLMSSEDVNHFEPQKKTIHIDEMHQLCSVGRDVSDLRISVMQNDMNKRALKSMFECLREFYNIEILMVDLSRLEIDDEFFGWLFDALREFTNPIKLMFNLNQSNFNQKMLKQIRFDNLNILAISMTQTDISGLILLQFCSENKEDILLLEEFQIRGKQQQIYIILFVFTRIDNEAKMALRRDFRNVDIK